MLRVKATKDLRIGKDVNIVKIAGLSLVREHPARLAVFASLPLKMKLEWRIWLFFAISLKIYTGKKFFSQSS